MRKRSRPQHPVLINPPQDVDALPVVLDSPHSSSHYPPDFEFQLPLGLMRHAEDLLVDRLFEAAPRLGATLIVANFARTYIDPNRSEHELDPDLLAERWPHPLRHSDKIRHGAGLIRATMGRHRRPVYARKLRAQEVRHRIEHYWRPYHQALARTLDEVHERFGFVIHLNCHSTSSIWPSLYPDAGRPNGFDYLLGDRDGRTCAPALTELVRRFLAERGHRVAVNHRYKGRELIRAYSAPAAGRHSLQIEINKRLYLDEGRFRPGERFAEERASMTALVTVLCRAAREWIAAGPSVPPASPR